MCFFHGRYLCLNLHGKTHDVFSLGMVAVPGSLPAESAIILIQDRLRDFGLDLKRHIVAAVTDGAAMMIKLVKLMGIEHQICHSHGGHLAVCDLIYKQKTNSAAGTRAIDAEADLNDDAEEEEEEEEKEEEVEEEEVEEEGNTEESVEGEEMTTDEGQNTADALTEELEPIIPGLQDNLSPIIKKIRRVVKFFKKSPVRNAKLQSYIRAASSCNKSSQLVLDVITRWNSLLKMLKSYRKFPKEIEKALIDLGRKDLILSDAEVASIDGLIDVLETVEVGTLTLSKNDTDLFKADGVIEFMIEKVRSDSSVYGQRMNTILENRLTQRRNRDVAGMGGSHHSIKQVFDKTTNDL